MTAPGSNASRTYAPGSVGYLLTTMIASRPGQNHGLTAEYATKIQAYTGPAQYGTGRLRAFPEAMVSSRRIQLGFDPEIDLHGTEEDETDGPVDGSLPLGASWDLSAGVENLAVSVNVEISREDVPEEFRAEYDALCASTVGALNFRANDQQALLGAVVRPTGPVDTRRDSLLSASLDQATTAIGGAGPPCFDLRGVLSGHIDLSEREDVTDDSRKVDIPCKARVFFTSPTAVSAVPDLPSDDEDMSSDGE